MVEGSGGDIGAISRGAARVRRRTDIDAVIKFSSRSTLTDGAIALTSASSSETSA